MTLGKFNLGNLAAAALAGIIATVTSVLGAGHSDAKSLSSAVAIGAGAGLLAGLVPPHNADGTVSASYEIAATGASLIPGNSAQSAETVLATAASLPAVASATGATPAAGSGTGLSDEAGAAIGVAVQALSSLLAKK